MCVSFGGKEWEKLSDLYMYHMTSLAQGLAQIRLQESIVEVKTHLKVIAVSLIIVQNSGP